MIHGRPTVFDISRNSEAKIYVFSIYCICVCAAKTKENVEQMCLCEPQQAIKNENSSGIRVLSELHRDRCIYFIFLNNRSTRLIYTPLAITKCM